MVINAVKMLSLFRSRGNPTNSNLDKVQLNLNAANATILVCTFARIWSGLVAPYPETSVAFNDRRARCLPPPALARPVASLCAASGRYRRRAAAT